MKRQMIISALLVVLLLPSLSLAGESEKTYCPVKYYLKAESVDQCLKCHATGTFEVKSANPLNKYELPDVNNVRLFDDDGKLTLYYLMGMIDDDAIKAIFSWLQWNPEVKNFQLEVHSPGGSLMDAWRIVGIIEQWKASDKKHRVETQVHGFAASAGFLIFMSGDVRTAAPTAELMWHELSVSGAGYQTTSPSSSKEEARILAHLQKTATEYLAGKCKLTVGKIAESVKDGRELWINGREALDVGVATRLAGE